jgi:transposase-like protein
MIRSSDDPIYKSVRSVLISGKVLFMATEDTTCPDCGIEMDQIEKTTFSGRDMREYQCPRCKRTQIVDCGEALWKILSDANKPDTQ